VLTSLLRHQRADGGLDSAGISTQSETAYAALALHTPRPRGVCAGEVQPAIARGAARLADVKERSEGTRLKLITSSRLTTCYIRVLAATDVKKAKKLRSLSPSSSAPRRIDAVSDEEISRSQVN
jgi:hypothetical protein